VICIAITDALIVVFGEKYIVRIIYFLWGATMSPTKVNG